MYFRPQSIWVAGLVRQSEPEVCILLPGRDCGMPYAPEEALRARSFQLDSPVHSRSREPHWLAPKPLASIIRLPMARLPPPPPPGPGPEFFFWLALLALSTFLYIPL